MNRRRVLGLATGAGGAAALAAVGVPLLSGWRPTDSTGAMLASGTKLPEPFTRPLPVPPVLAPVRRDATTDYYDITQRAAEVEILPGHHTPIWGYDGIFPGPTVVSRSGRQTVVRHRNALTVPVVVHLHGGHTPPESDGFPLDLVAPGTDREYRYPMRQRAATLWYHDHRMDATGAAVWRGLAGFHLVHDDEEDALGLPSGSRDLPLMIADRSFAADGSLRYPGAHHGHGVEAGHVAGVLGDVVLVNGAPWPVAEVPAVRHRLRLLNGANARRFRLALDPPPPGGRGLVQIASDGGLLARPRPHDAIDLAPGQRFDVVVDFGRYRPGQVVTLVNGFGTGPTRHVMRFRVGARTADDSRIPSTLSTVEPLATVRPAVRRRFEFRTGPVAGRTGWTVNGKPFDPARADADPRLGEVEVWRFQSDFHHPVHLHLVPFQVLSRNGGDPGPYDHGWQDTVDLRPHEEVTVAARFTGYPGRYVLHCHNLEHEDMAMMATVVVRG